MLEIKLTPVNGDVSLKYHLPLPQGEERAAESSRPGEGVSLSLRERVAESARPGEGALPDA